MKLDKPDFLPFTHLPIPREHSIEAGKYLFSLEVSEGPLGTNHVYEILTGEPLGIDRPLNQIRIARQVFQVIGREAPHSRKYNPEQVLQALERA